MTTHASCISRVQLRIRLVNTVYRYQDRYRTYLPMTVPKACHNCRRRRLRCDRSVPECLKCGRTGQKCLGYGQLYRWTEPLQSHIHGHCPRPDTITPCTAESPEKEVLPVGPGITLADPLLQDLSPSSRRYLTYYTSRFCRDLVVHDSARQGGNPFRELIPLSQRYPYLQNIIVAVSAVHFSRAASYATPDTQQCSQMATASLVDALHARQKAIHQLLGALQHRYPSRGSHRGQNEDEGEALLATVLFFVNFSMIDSGRDGWRSHLKAAGRLLPIPGAHHPPILSASIGSMGVQHGSLAHLGDLAMSAGQSQLLTKWPLPSAPLRACDFVASDTMAYFIWNSALESLSSTTPRSVIQTGDWDMNNILGILLRTEANSYHSCPAYLMHIVLRTSHLAQAIRSNSREIPTDKQLDVCIALFREAQSFDVDGWAAGVCARNPGMMDIPDQLEFEFRGHIAATYRASVCLYILLIAPGLPAVLRARSKRGVDEILPDVADGEYFASTVLRRLSLIPRESPLFKYTTWPLFLAGVETASPARREWILERLRAMRTICPWEMLTAAMETLADVWRLRDSRSPDEDTKSPDVARNGDFRADDGAVDSRVWLARLRGVQINCLIV
ncbi:hypothetical protein GGR56DRAFT_112637 [Xylariaceae sp. FL0804]|nr:hypothetical protein GGR56DRAFT_112637 [Xylariaceae sp. FL0804]